eukprot:CAMPEP_0206581312 /NCGR_PEP_ID=MMETSP0325_2-20121206/33759_1 /ASSEMBLY_ACC=CAM_ASM_000347 /TAXON_ID=2866 /ORGANISM="Crypthecodinium cohnii, Strain Seligo" /LENGTH=47 /DNA_ID= /DNA_START= /DNA_END= /DNA_ORIENTATION=
MTTSRARIPHGSRMDDEMVDQVITEGEVDTTRRRQKRPHELQHRRAL